MAQEKSELFVIMKAKDLCSYVMLITQKSPKQYRFTLTTRMQNLCMDIIEALYLANETFIMDSNLKERMQRRLDYQHEVVTKTRISII